jgi:hypothetical protein
VYEDMQGRDTFDVEKVYEEYKEMFESKEQVPGMKEREEKLKKKFKTVDL